MNDESDNVYPDMNVIYPDEIHSWDELGAFMKWLAGVVDDAKPDDFENRQSVDFLKAGARWLEDADAAYRNNGAVMPTEPSWIVFAQLLINGLEYE